MQKHSIVKSVVFLLLILASFSVLLTSAKSKSASGDQEKPSNPMQLNLNASVSTCKQDKEIPEERLAAIDNAAMLFVRAVLGSDPSIAYPTLTTEAQKATSKNQFEYYMRMAVDPFAPFADLAISHTYLADVLGKPQGSQMVCGTLSEPENWVSFRVEPSSKQAWVTIEGKARNNAWTFTTWLIPVDGVWKINSFNAGASTLANQSTGDIWKVAQSEYAHHHSFNAFVLSNAALQLAQRGPFFEFGIASVIREHLSRTPPPSLFQGKPPFTWQLGAHRFQVINVSPLSVAGKVYLDIAYQVQPWKNYNEVDQQDRKLIQDFASTVPEYSAVFAGIIAEAHAIGRNQGYRTVAVVHNGSLEILPPPGKER